jgi:hypothetical protein
MNGALNLTPARIFPRGGFLCSIVFDVVRRLKRLLLVIGGLLSRNRPTPCYDLFFYYADAERVCPTIDGILWRAVVIFWLFPISWGDYYM